MADHPQPTTATADLVPSPPAPSPASAPGTRLGAGPHAYLLASLAGTWLLVFLPLLLMLALVLWLIEFVLAAATLDKTGGLDPDTFVTGLWLGVLATVGLLGLRVFGGFVRWARRVTPTTGPPGLKRRFGGFLAANAGCGCATLLLTLLALLALVMVPLEWGGNRWLPDILSSAPVLVLFVVLSALVPFELFWRSITAVFWVYRRVVRRPFMAGMVAGACSLLLLPAVPLAYLTLGDDPSGDVAIEPVAPPAPAAAFDVVDAIRTTMVEVAAAGAEDPAVAGGGAETDAVYACMEGLYGGPRGGLSDFDKAKWNIQLRFQLSDDDAYDAAMKALVNVCTSESLQTFDNLAAVFTRAVQNEAINVIRQRIGEPVDDELLVCFPFFDDETRLKTEINAARAAFQSLDATTQAAIKLWAAGYTYREIARELRVTEAQAHDMVGNGVKKMRRAVAKTCYY